MPVDVQVEPGSAAAGSSTRPGWTTRLSPGASTACTVRPSSPTESNVCTMPSGAWLVSTTQ